ncbi:hypothetical protein BASA50_007412 [Batrachochytrium salamandrivorans]|uniref:Uncharacterized protein n=1 Tax=Batrachochytrium salamandrivorans TaxID=1357716 RepID=A0ABQ8F0M5_9FUNG|nr:hypothetical protein BASA60_000203 [Batrachochytrium salamandrivorans]KAH6588303.1 hypothetical protein BASA50_010798 [Batrachochytrium salamandrivorans]KAH6593205.1 hypothetical protein BASA50_007412 [Batrachochytrium salamandrivorans]KAH9248131.1 hypothetical protein BASA81_014252 [Batrachochytrium salamandrivorans]KAH9274108.1 hypothetical protein BASA83_003410 [Batrachochytrium salamandrivorans]
MQFFHLFSFVVVASYAAALPQPAGLSEKYSNSVDTTLASGLETRSYQPGLNSYKDSATLMSLKRRDDSEESPEDNSGGSPEDNSERSPEANSGGSSEDNSELDSTQPLVTIFEETVKYFFSDSDLSSKNLSSTIDRVGDGDFVFFENGELAGNKIGGTIGNMMGKYFRRATYVSTVLRNWSHKVAPDIVKFIKSSLGDEEYSKVEPGWLKTSRKLGFDFDEEVDEVIAATKNILEEVGFVTENMQRIHKSFQRTFDNRRRFILNLSELLGKFGAGKIIQEYLADVIRSLFDFGALQRYYYDVIIQDLMILSSQ